MIGDGEVEHLGSPQSWERVVEHLGSPQSWERVVEHLGSPQSWERVVEHLGSPQSWERVGEGSYGKVYRAPRCDGKPDVVAVAREVRILRKLDSEHVV
eukprot:gene2992-48220_t